MKRLRSILAGNRQAFALFVALTLAVRLLVPAGFMPSLDEGRVTLTLCGGTVPAPAMPQAMAHHSGDHAMPAMAGSHDEHGAKETPCAFTDLALAPLQTADAPVVFPPEAAPLPPVVPEPTTLARQALERLRPPSRAPPAIA